MCVFWLQGLSAVSFVAAGSFFACAPVSFSLGFDEGSSAGSELFGSVLCSVLADLSVECFVVDFFFG